MTPIRRCGSSIAGLFALALFGAAPALGATHMWIGPTNGAWSNAANWSGGSKPTSGEVGGTIVQFGANTTSSMDIAGLAVDQIHFTGANNTINGSTALTISGSTLVQNIVSDAGANTLASSLPIALTGEATEGASSAGTLTIAGAVSGSPGLVFVSTGGDFALTGNNSYAGPTTIESGAVHISNNVGYVIPGSSLTIGGQGLGAQLVDNVQSSDVSPNTDVIVNSDGVFNFQSETETAKTLTVNGGSVLGGSLTMTGALTMTNGTVAIGSAGVVSAGSLSLTGGTISGPGVLALSGNIQATSSPYGPATVSSGVQLHASPTITVTSGTAPALRFSGVISETGGSRSITKAGTGTMLTSANNTYTGATTVSAGTLLADGSQVGAFSVGQNGTLGGSGTVGATSVAGVLAPVAPGLHTRALSFGPTGRLDVSVTSVALGATPSVIATGTVNIDPSAALNLVVAPGSAVPHGSNLLLIEGGSGAIGGQFTGVPTGAVLTTPDGVSLVVSYAGGDGNDLILTAGNVAPQISPISATPNPVVAGQPVALSVTESDANQDPLTTTWNLGDGATGAGAATSHAYTNPGIYTAIATVSDGLAQVQSTTVITVTAPTAVGTGTPAGAAAGSRGTATVTSSGYGAAFGLTVASACVREGTPFSVTLGIKKKTTGRAGGNVLVKVAKVVFAIDGKTIKTDRFAPFRVSLTVTRAATSGARINLVAKAHLTLRGNKRRSKSIAIVLRMC